MPPQPVIIHRSIQAKTPGKIYETRSRRPQVADVGAGIGRAFVEANAGGPTVGRRSALHAEVHRLRSFADAADGRAVEGHRLHGN
jgi:hypothetical protein